MQLFIPTIGTKLTLIASWQFSLHVEYRNWGMWRVVNGTDDNGKKVVNVTLPSGTVLTVDRIYIRKGNKEFDSVTFRVFSCPDERFKGQRFWAKLDDVNYIDCEVHRGGQGDR